MPGPSQATSSSKASLAWPSGLSSALGGLSQTRRPASPRPDPRRRALSAPDVVPECPGPSGQLSRAFPPSSHNYSNPVATFRAPLAAKASKRKRWDDSGVTRPQEMYPCDDIWWGDGQRRRGLDSREVWASGGASVSAPDQLTSQRVSMYCQMNTG